MFAGNAAHGMMPLDRALTGGIGLTLCALCHIAGWPVPRGGAQSISNALAGYLKSLGGEVVTDAPVTSIDKLPAAKIVMADLSPRPLLRIAGHRLPLTYRTKLERYRYGMGVFKVDWALSSPIPWTADGCRRAGTIHLGASLDEIAASEQGAWNGTPVDRPYVLLSQPTIVDPSRAPSGKHIAWAYCHVPGGSTVDMLERIERQIERFAPGFRECVLARSVMTPADIERHNPNLVGGDIAGGVTDLRQFFTRPTWRNYATPIKGLYLCSASTPPGVGVHGMCGYWAGRLAIKQGTRCWVLRVLGSVVGGRWSVVGGRVVSLGHRCPQYLVRTRYPSRECHNARLQGGRHERAFPRTASLLEDGVDGARRGGRRRIRRQGKDGLRPVRDIRDQGQRG